MNFVRRRGLVLPAILALCASPAFGKAALDLQSPPPATCAAPRAWQLAEAPFDKKVVHANAVTLANPSTYYVQVGGGSAIATLLFGPIGMAANAASIKQRTEAQANAIDKVNLIDPRDLVADAIASRTADAAAGAPIVVRPMLIFVRPKKSDDVERRLVFDITCDGWHGWYSAHLAPVSAARLNETMSGGEAAIWNTNLREASIELFAVFDNDARGKAGTPRAMQVASIQLNPYFAAELPQGVRDAFDSYAVVVGQGQADSKKFMLTFMKGVHLMDPTRIAVGKPW